jgi:hypothetical protein
VLSLATDPFDLVIQGVATRVTDTDGLTAVAEVYAVQGWPAHVEGDALTAEFSAPSGQAAVLAVWPRAGSGVRLRHRGAVRRHQVRPVSADTALRSFTGREIGGVDDLVGGSVRQVRSTSGSTTKIKLDRAEPSRAAIGLMASPLGLKPVRPLGN